MASIRKSLLQFLMSGVYMKRWNDKLRPTEFYEVDKQAHKMIVAFALAELYAQNRNLNISERQELHATIVKNGIYEYLFRLVITDIKPSILNNIRNKESEFSALAQWGLDETERYVRPLGDALWNDYVQYVKRPKLVAKNDSIEQVAETILYASHVFSSLWEYKLIEKLNVYDDETNSVLKELRNTLKEYAILDEIKLLEDRHSALYKFVAFCGQLRFQKRWSQVPRVPETSVLGHMFIVAVYAYCFSVVEEACSARCINNFYGGLFHDLPELLTRDIISPVKKATENLANIIQQYEKSEMDKRVFEPLKNAGLTNILERLKYYLGYEVGSEFKECIILDNKVKKIDFNELSTFYNENKYDPKDGSLIKTCDTLAAFIEAYLAVRNGMSSEQLHEALWRMRTEQMKKTTYLKHIHLASLYADFD
ncbi:HD domain-containing protein [Desulfovibrio litoralis]|uniref:Putative hydrolases of HD superfamily n=1 Tax=Desulfovibrio litoralis DSM 11393 TaxID=1121455 RepID=A0A1M7S0D8_9BACT|nr:HD domain-containing protein [Desulfovibrio litoralis]SHN51782.1 putative hydrolases of HD superfamily [Desulfovibrio litoralis DSM 11393]